MLGNLSSLSIPKASKIVFKSSDGLVVLKYPPGRASAVQSRSAAWMRPADKPDSQFSVLFVVLPYVVKTNLRVAPDKLTDF